MTKLSTFVPATLVMPCAKTAARDVVEMLRSQRVHSVSLPLYALGKANTDLAALVKERWEEMRKAR